MKKFCVMTALTSEIVSGGRRVSQCVSRSILVFNAEDLRNTSICSCLLVFRCKNFSIDEEASSGDWKNAFEYRIESGDMVVITINPDFSKPVVIMPFFEGKNWCGLLSAPFLIKNRKLKENHYKKVRFFIDCGYILCEGNSI